MSQGLIKFWSEMHQQFGIFVPKTLSGRYLLTLMLVSQSVALAVAMSAIDVFHILIYASID